MRIIHLSFQPIYFTRIHQWGQPGVRGFQVVDRIQLDIKDINTNKDKNQVIVVYFLHQKNHLGLLQVATMFYTDNYNIHIINALQQNGLSLSIKNGRMNIHCRLGHCLGKESVGDFVLEWPKIINCIISPFFILWQCVGCLSEFYLISFKL